MKKTIARSIILLTSLAMASLQASASVIIEYDEPNGQLLQGQSSEVWLNLTSDAELVFDWTDADEDGTFGNLVENGYLPPTAQYLQDADAGNGEVVSFDSIESVYLGTSVTLSSSEAGESSFETSGQFEFVYNIAPESSIYALFNQPILAGVSYRVLLGTFVPTSSDTMLGSYNILSHGLGFSVRGIGTDSRGEQFNLRDFVKIADTCPNFDVSCQFSRTVVTSVSAPNSILLLSSTLLLFFLLAKDKTLR